MTNTVGSSADIQDRVLKVLPRRWFAWVAPYRDGVVGGLSDLAAWSYALIGYAKAQTRISTAYGIWLDVIAYDFLGPTLRRGSSPDSIFRAIIKATILRERVTRAGMVTAVTAVTGNTPTIFEPWNTGDTGAYSSAAVGGFKGGQFGYGVGAGGYGNMNMPGEVLMRVSRTAPSGVPNVGGYDSDVGGYGAGSLEYVGTTTELQGITDEMIETVINLTKPTGVAAFIAFAPASIGAARRPVILNSKADTQNLSII